MRLTVKQDNFCKAYIECSNASEAYRRSYNAGKMKADTIHRKAFDVLENGKVSARIAELQQMGVDKHLVTVGKLTIELDEALEMAKSLDNPAAMISATMSKGKLHGLLIEKNQITGAGGGPVKTASVINFIPVGND